MRYFKRKTVISHKEVETLDYYQCDICNKNYRVEAKEGKDGLYRIETSTEVGIKKTVRKIGKYDDMDYTRSTYSIDMCLECWEEKFMVWLKSLGVQLVEETKEYR